MTDKEIMCELVECGIIVDGLKNKLSDELDAHVAGLVLKKITDLLVHFDGQREKKIKSIDDLIKKTFEE